MVSVYRLCCMQLPCACHLANQLQSSQSKRSNICGTSLHPITFTWQVSLAPSTTSCICPPPHGTISWTHGSSSQVSKAALYSNSAHTVAVLCPFLAKSRGINGYGILPEHDLFGSCIYACGSSRLDGLSLTTHSTVDKGLPCRQQTCMETKSCCLQMSFVFVSQASGAQCVWDGRWRLLGILLH